MYIPLGAFRLMLATFVFIVHTDGVMRPGTDFINWAGLGVWLFFIVSGYVIFSAYDSFYRGRPAHYLLNRCVRVYPTLWLCLLFSLLLLYLHEHEGLPIEGLRWDGYDWREFLLGLSIVGGFINDTVWKPLPPAGTLTVEVQFYFIAGAVFFLIKWLRVSLERGLFWAAIVFLTAYVLVSLTGSQYRWFGVLRYSPLFILGGLVCFTMRLGLRGTGLRILWAVTTPLFLHFLMTNQSSTGYIGFNTQPQTLITGALVVLAFGAMVWLARQFVGAGVKRIDRFLGDLTYPLYLIQIPVLTVVLPTRHWSGLGDWLILYGINLAAATVVTVCLERPLQFIRRQIRGQAIAV